MQKRIILFTFLLFFTIHSIAQVVIDAKGTKTTIDPSKWSTSGNDIYNKNTGGVGVGTAGAPNADAALEVRSTSKGVLISRVALSATNAVAPLSAHVAGMMVYNTATAGTAPNNVTPGFYYNDGNKWVRVADATSGDLTNDEWVNDAAISGVKVGKKSDGTNRDANTDIVVKDNGRVGIGTTNPAWMLDIMGPAAIGQIKRIGPGLTDTQAPGFLFTRSAGSPGAEQNINVGDFLGKVQFRGRVGGSDKDFATFAYVAEGTTATIADGTSASNSSSAGRFAFLTGPGNNVSRELMSINTTSGNVGISKVAPKSLLDINGYAKLGNADVTADALTAPADRAGMIRYNSTTKALQYHDDTQWLTAASTATADITNDAWVNDSSVGNTMVKLGTQSNGTTARATTAEVVIKDDGRVGIGTTAPTTKLDVKGTIAAPNYTTTIQAITGTWDLNLGGNATWNLAAGSNTLTINNAAAGMFGMLKLVNSGTSSITLPAASKVINNGGGSVLLTQTASAVDILTFYYDGTNYWWTYGNNYN